jgi:hypothetical protein
VHPSSLLAKLTPKEMPQMIDEASCDDLLEGLDLFL